MRRLSGLGMSLALISLKMLTPYSAAMCFSSSPGFTTYATTRGVGLTAGAGVAVARGVAVGGASVGGTSKFVTIGLAGSFVWSARAANDGAASDTVASC